MSRLVLAAVAAFAVGWVCCAARMNARIRRLVGEAQVWAREATHAWGQLEALEAQVERLNNELDDVWDAGWQSGANVRVDLGGQP